jgi:tetratricopeptide (TPR) repeat protein
MVDHALDPVAFGKLELHMDECPDCREAVAALALGSQPTGTPESPWVAPGSAAPARTAAIGDRYAVVSVIGSGGMGRILSAYDRRLHRKIALKELRVVRPELERRFQREALLTARLEHPNIVSLHEAETWPSGEPFYTMRLVSGRPLDKVIADASTLAQRLALLPHAIAVADALAYAHQERIIHRDLKPQNVMVGEFGETVVIDWGLAKDLSGVVPDEVGAGPYRTRPEAIGETRVGEVMGTPAYMPPEQAEAASVGATADVYAIGAILYHLLAGAPPYKGKTSLEVLEAVTHGPPVPLSERQAGVPLDLLAVIDRAMARDPAARYPTARELAEDLRRFQTGQLVGAHRYSPGQLLARWLRRHRAAVIVAGIATTLLLTLGALAFQRVVRAQHAAEDQQGLAESRRGDAEDLLGFMLVDLRDKLKPAGRLDLLDDAAKKAIAYYDRHGEPADDAELAKRALARRNLGDVLSAQGHSEGALREYRASQAIVEALAARDPANARRQHDRAISYERVGNVTLAQGDAAGALVAYRASLAIDETLASRDPSDADWQQDVALGHDKVGDVVRSQGDAAGALAEYRAALAVRGALASQDLQNAGRQRDLFTSHVKIGEVLLVQGESARALAELRMALAIAGALASKDPANAERKRDVAFVHGRVGDILLDQGNAAEALVELQTSLTIAEALATKDPTNAQHQHDIVIAQQQVGDAQLALGDATRALAAYRAAIEVSVSLVSKDPANADYARNLSVSHEKVGDVLLQDKKDARGALDEYRTVLALDVSLAAKDPTNVVLQSDLVLIHAKVGDVLLLQGDVARSLAEHKAALALAETLVTKDPTNTERQNDLAVAHSRVGEVLLAQHDSSGALAEYRAALAIAERFEAKDPNNADWRKLTTELTKRVTTLASTPNR